MTKRTADIAKLDDLGGSIHGMHPRNQYKNNPPNFKQLAKECPELQPFVCGLESNPYIDFKNPEASRALTIALLERDFGLQVDFPLDRLCPTVPNRLNYILWLQDLLKETMQDKPDHILGMDIGVGASCIYPLLGCVSDPTWSFIGTDIDQVSIEYAQKNVERNQLQDRITLIHNTDPNLIFLWDKIPLNSRFAFSMCNPPFYESEDEIKDNSQAKLLEPSAICTGTKGEMITKGGEYGFIERMIKESILHKGRIKWYTSMIGQKKTIKPIVNTLKDLNINNYVVTEFNQGKTKRWAIGWSFDTQRAVDARSLDFYRPKSQFTIQLPKDISHVHSKTIDILQDLAIKFNQEDGHHIILEGSPKANTWSRAARRKKNCVTPRDCDGLFGFRLMLAEQN
ncbi:hypothetical protein F4703DRAFT_1800025 [Phycomyces blakesleeanus]|uniref:U6 small nuclear RNA (adenine-(43)-N(6))-methyltransferase n=1 Tax=Phycomyces blakesleeanus (strain ATCC 8743b / DSM 1359 / FGSC 10004 / NBRC 33097 / NRRL 1555) TaxID=763407 RepID=A0A162PZY1_PHYB8|nr:hypothetical protein PHYBLDRAFT_59427 [Phycomyces blakesleeanus NRRL 1555(-)]OAD75896.1 hypothetical protein PHYBLDRAFT_59427 [Phycomyces blakesleeanus NRRL 1555(-)]|eukprot:XP_018293936.1 hypothetical protein PHYBLDRAFT_59427 [Phycomyces blakesleeanus NRRL 1555(-)]